MRRRDVLRLGGALTAGALVGASPWRTLLQQAQAAHAAPLDCSHDDPAGPYGPLRDPDANGIMLPEGFTSRVIARAGQPVGDTGYLWHVFPDGGATFRSRRGGHIYVSNSEGGGPIGCSAVHFDKRGNIIGAYPILTGTIINCAGGATPWGTWLSCEEFAGGHVWECDPTGAQPGIMRPALGTFRHEAVCVDRRQRIIYLTEDIGDGRFYRFRPTNWGHLSQGVLEVAAVDADGNVTWLVVPAPNDTVTPTRLQVPQSTAFRGGEGIVYRRRHVYFTTKGDNRVWDYNTFRQTISVLYEAGTPDPSRPLRGVDNIAVVPRGHLVVAEDGDNMELVVVSPRGGLAVPMLRVLNQPGSELAGPAFSPDGRSLYFSSQRGGGQGITYEIAGRFRRPWPRVCVTG